MIKGWKNNPDWRKYFDLRGEAKVQERLAEENNELMRKAVVAQETNLREQQEHRAKSEAHWRECHAEKVAAGEIPERKTN